jgi:hypothetical protein
LPATTDIF